MNEREMAKKIERIITDYLRSQGSYLSNGAVNIGGVKVRLDKLAEEIAFEMSK